MSEQEPGKHEQEFERAKSWVASPAAEGLFSNKVKLDLYGAFKQATVGDCPGSKPWGPEAGYKWNAWNSHRGATKEEAMRRYVDVVDEIAPTWREAADEPAELAASLVEEPVSPVRFLSCESVGAHDDDDPMAATAPDPVEDKLAPATGAPAHVARLPREGEPSASLMKGVTRGLGFLGSAAWIALRYQLTPNKCRDGTEEEREAEACRINREAAVRALELVTSFKGYYIKAAQTLCGAGQFPPEFDDAFGVLLDQCPKEPFEVVRGIVEEELDCPLDTVFREFSPDAVAAASIGQVHFAELLDGTRVAVKVQYPDVERFFKTDIGAVSFAMQILGMGAKVKEVFRTMQDQFQLEFDYTKEAAVMREVAENVIPKFGERVQIPLPVDAAHPRCPLEVVPTLCTRKVLTMERLEGMPIKQHVLPLLEMFADRYGTSVEELKKLMDTKDPANIDMDNKAVRAAMSMDEVSECKSGLLIFAVKVRNLTARVVGGCAAECCHATPPAWAARKMAVPLNGPRIAKLLYEVHGHEIFQNGLFNSDPHAGNVLMLPDGRVGLIDYGAVMRLSEELRTSLAKLMVAIAEEDDDAVAPAFWACGFQSEKKDPRLALLLAHLFFNRGPWPRDMNRLAPKVGMPLDASILTLDRYTRGGKLDNILEFPGHLVMLQRCCMVLSGIGMELGAGRLSSAGMLKPQALNWLHRHRP